MKYKLAEIQVSYRKPEHAEIIQVQGSQDAHNVLKSNWNPDTLDFQEEFKLLLMNRANQVIGIYNLSRGGVSGTVVDAKILFATALKCLASSIILAHNHPSGNLKPSEADLELTNKIKLAGELLDIKVLDHIILTSAAYYSFADEGIM